MWSGRQKVLVVLWSRSLRRTGAPAAGSAESTEAEHSALEGRPMYVLLALMLVCSAMLACNAGLSADGEEARIASFCADWKSAMGQVWREPDSPPELQAAAGGSCALDEMPCVCDCAQGQAARCREVDLTVEEARISILEGG